MTNDFKEQLILVLHDHHKQDIMDISYYNFIFYFNLVLMQK
jgi:hypothetical protein